MKELVIVVGLPRSGTVTFSKKSFPTHQIITKYGLREAISYVKVEQNTNALYLITEISVRASMIVGHPIVIVENSYSIETILIWKKIAIDHEYKVKVVVYNKPVEECFFNQEKQEQGMLKHYLDLEKQFNQLKEILTMDHQKIVDEVEIVETSQEDKKDEILQN